MRLHPTFSVGTSTAGAPSGKAIVPDVLAALEPKPEAGNATSAVQPLRALRALCIALPGLLFILLAILSWPARVADAEASLRAANDIALQHANAVFATYELVSRHVANLLEKLPDAEIAATAPRLSQELTSLIQDQQQIEDIFVIDRQGRALLAAHAFTGAIGRDYADRSYFRAERERGQLYISERLIGRVDHLPFFAVATRRPSPDGQFNGVIVAAVAPRFFDAFWKDLKARLDPQDGYAFGLIRSDGRVLARFPEGSAPLSEDRTASPGFISEVASMPLEGMYQHVSPGDGRYRFVSYRRLARFPLYVTTSVPRSDIAATWLRGLAVPFAIGFPATLCLVGMAEVALRRAKAEADAHAKADMEVRRRAEAEAALRHAQKLEAVGQLTGGIAHDFNNLLTAIMGSLELIGRSTADPKRVAHLAAAGLEAAKRGATLTTSLLAFSRRQSLMPEIVDVNALIRGFPLAQRAIGEAVRLELDLDPSQPHCRVDAAQLEAAVLNLAINARDAMPRGGVLRIATRCVALGTGDLVGNADAEPGDFVALTVADTGAGMTPDVLARATEPYFTTKSVGRGSGLGLSQVYGYARQSRGHLAIDSTPDGGTTVTLYLPLAEVASTAAAPPPPVPAPFVAPATILLVEDEPAVRETVRQGLVDAGCRIVMARNGVEALALLEGGAQPDVLISDVVMPGGVSGVEVARRAQAIDARIKVLLVSGYAAPALAAHGVGEGEFDLLNKPFTAAELVGRVAAMLSRDPLGHTQTADQPPIRDAATNPVAAG
jgi:signal transduction histidine kinase/FixJ family two-component response regulator